MKSYYGRSNFFRRKWGLYKTSRPSWNHAKWCSITFSAERGYVPSKYLTCDCSGNYGVKKIKKEKKKTKKDFFYERFVKKLITNDDFCFCAHYYSRRNKLCLYCSYTFFKENKLEALLIRKYLTNKL
jgi:hypothetical protein